LAVLEASRAAILGLDQRAQDLLGAPALGLGHLQNLGGITAHRGQLQPPQRGVEIGSQRRHRRRCGCFHDARAGGGHDAVPSAVVSLIL
jgi:hypothetical protein